MKMSVTPVNDVLDAPGGLSIVMQGTLRHSNAGALANICASWRRLFPAAQLICSISSSDCLLGMVPEGALADRLEPIVGLIADSQFVGALASIEASCDVLVYAPAAMPLPPIKSDNPGVNNVNLLIASSRAGLAQVRGRYVLRVRNDLLLRDRSFLAGYTAGQDAPRGEWSVFEERVMIAEVFTLNPYTLSRMPFHFSDWLHFGLTADVRAIWDAAAPMTLEDAVFYEGEAHLPRSNVVERRFRSRLAPEQAISFGVFKRAFPSLVLERHNDRTCVEASLLVLADNFVIANLKDCRAYIAAYQHLVNKMSVYTRLECMSQGLVRERADHRDVPAERLYAALLERTARFDSCFNRWLRGARVRMLRMARRVAN